MAGYALKKSIDGTYHAIPKTNITRALDAVKRYDLNRVTEGGLVFPGNLAGPVPTLADNDTVYVATGAAVQAGRLVRWSSASIAFAATASRVGISLVYIPNVAVGTTIAAAPTYYTLAGYTTQPSISKSATPLAFVTRSAAYIPTLVPSYGIEQGMIDNDARAELFAPIKLIAG